MRNAMRYRGSILLARSHQRTSAFRSSAVACIASLMASARRLDDRDKSIDSGTLQHLLRSRRPIDDDAIHPLVGTKPKMQAPIVLAGESGSAIDDASLGEISRLDHYLGADRTAIAARTDEPEGDPVTAAVRIVAIQHRRLILIGDDHIL